MGDYPQKLEHKVISLQRNTEELLKLLGGGEDDRLSFWEILKGITTPVQWRIVENVIDVMEAQVQQAQRSAKLLEHEAKELAGERM